jgi:hypothetical protein
MTDLATKPEPATNGDGADSGAPVEWAPADEQPKKGRRGLWLGIGIPAGLLAVGAGVCSAILIAPGVVVAGADVGWHTAGSASETIAANLAGTEITLTTEAGDITLPASELGVTADSGALAEQAYGEYPLWNVGAWNPGAIDAEVSLDAAVAGEALRAQMPELFTDPVNAGVSFDGDAGSYTVADAQAGSGVDLDALSEEISRAIGTGEDELTVPVQLTEVEASVTTADAQAEAEQLNALVADAGFYVGEEKAVGLEPAQLAGWLNVEATDDGFQVTADEAAIDEFVQGLPEQVNQEVVDAEVVTNSAGDALRTIKEGQDGWGLESTDGIAAGFAEQLANGDGSFELPVEPIKHETVELFRRIDVDKSAGTTTLFETKDDGAEEVVATYPIALGRPGYDTQEGNFTVYGQLTIQNMGSCDAQGNYVPGGKFDYCTANVPWVTYFNGDQGFHGTYWHSNFGAGAYMSHGCVNMTEAAAEHVYYFAQTGTEVSVHS